MARARFRKSAFRRGDLDAALEKLRAAHLRLDDPEVAAHLGEVLWRKGEHDEARRIWAEALKREAESISRDERTQEQNAVGKVLRQSCETDFQRADLINGWAGRTRVEMGWTDEARS